LSNIDSKVSFRERCETYKLYFEGKWMIVMTEKRKRGIVKRGGWEIAKKVLKALPVIGSLFTVGFAGHDIKKKGLVAGAVHVGLDATPVVGTAKNVVEIFTGDWIPDKAKGPQAVSHRSEAAPIDESKH
jgi:hypothetical protein